MRMSDWSSDVCSSDLGQHADVNDFLIFARAERSTVERATIDLFRFPLERRAIARSEERSVGTECVSTCRSRSSPSHSKKQKTIYTPPNSNKHIRQILNIGHHRLKTRVSLKPTT